MHERAGQLAKPEDLINVDEVISAYYDLEPDVNEPAQAVSFGTSGHRGSSLDRAFNEAHIVATRPRLWNIVNHKVMTAPCSSGAIRTPYQSRRGVPPWRSSRAWKCAL